MRPPIPEPDGSSYSNVNERLYYIKFWPYFVYCSFGSTLLVSPLTLIPPERHIQLLPALAVLAAACTVMSAFITRACAVALPLRVSPDGIGAIDVWNLPARLPWDHIQRVRVTRILWLTYLRLDTPGKSPVLWVPLFLKKRSDFENSVFEFGGEGHPLVKCIRERQKVKR